MRLGPLFMSAAALVGSGCSKAQTVQPPPHTPEPAAHATLDAPTIEHLRGLIAAAPAGLRVVHELVAPHAEGAPQAGPLAWITTLPLSMELQVAAAGPVAVTLDGALVFDGTAPADGALVPATPLYVGRGELKILVERGPAAVGFVKVILDENPPASAFDRRDDAPR